MKTRLLPTLLAAATLVAASSASAATLNWDPSLSNTATGGGAGTWDTNTTANWFNGSADANWTDTTGVDTATFGGTAGAVTVSSVTANKLAFTTGGYSLTGGTIALKGTTPGITLSSGTTTIGSSLSATSGLALSGTGTLALTSTGTITGALSIASGTTLNLSSGNGTTGSIGGTGNSITLTGGGTLQVSGGQTNIGAGAITGFTGNYNLTGGLLYLKVNNGSTNTATWTMAGGQLQLYTTEYGAMTVNGTGSVISSNSGSGTFAGTIGGAGALTVQANSSNGNFLTLSGDMSSFTGSVTVAPTGSINNLVKATTNNAGSSQAAFIVNSSSTATTTFVTNTGTYLMGSLAGTAGTKALTITGGNGATTISVGGLGATTTFGGILANGTSGATGLNITGGSLTLGGLNTYTGGTTVTGGTLVTGNMNALGNGSVSLNGGTLQVGNQVTIGSSANITTTAATSILKFAANLGADTGSGALANITLAGGGKYDFSLGTVTLDLSNLFNAAGTYHLIAGGTSNVDAASYTFNNFDNSNWTATFANGDLVVAASAVPEPSTYGLIGAGALAAVAMVRRRRKAVVVA